MLATTVSHFWIKVKHHENESIIKTKPQNSFVSSDSLCRCVCLLGIKTTTLHCIDSDSIFFSSTHKTNQMWKKMLEHCNFEWTFYESFQRIARFDYSIQPNERCEVSNKEYQRYRVSVANKYVSIVLCYCSIFVLNLQSLSESGVIDWDAPIYHLSIFNINDYEWSSFMKTAKVCRLNVPFLLFR